MRCSVLWINRSSIIRCIIEGRISMTPVTFLPIHKKVLRPLTWDIYLFFVISSNLLLRFDIYMLDYIFPSQKIHTCMYWLLYFFRAGYSEVLRSYLPSNNPQIRPWIKLKFTTVMCIFLYTYKCKYVMHLCKFLIYINVIPSSYINKWPEKFCLPWMNVLYCS